MVDEKAIAHLLSTIPEINELEFKEYFVVERMVTAYLNRIVKKIDTKKKRLSSYTRCDDEFESIGEYGPGNPFPEHQDVQKEMEMLYGKGSWKRSDPMQKKGI